MMGPCSYMNFGGGVLGEGGSSNSSGASLLLELMLEALLEEGEGRWNSCISIFRSLNSLIMC